MSGLQMAPELGYFPVTPLNVPLRKALHPRWSPTVRIRLDWKTIQAVLTNWRPAAPLFAASLLALLGFVALNAWLNRAFIGRCADYHAHVGFPVP